MTDLRAAMTGRHQGGALTGRLDRLPADGGDGSPCVLEMAIEHVSVGRGGGRCPGDELLDDVPGFLDIEGEPQPAAAPRPSPGA